MAIDLGFIVPVRQSAKGRRRREAFHSCGASSSGEALARDSVAQLQGVEALIATIQYVMLTVTIRLGVHTLVLLAIYPSDLKFIVSD